MQGFHTVQAADAFVLGSCVLHLRCSQCHVVAALLLLCRAEKGIPGFWATVLARAELVQNEKDADALTYLTGEARCSNNRILRQQLHIQFARGNMRGGNSRRAALLDRMVQGVAGAVMLGSASAWRLLLLTILHKQQWQPGGLQKQSWQRRLCPVVLYHHHLATYHWCARHLLGPSLVVLLHKLAQPAAVLAANVSCVADITCESVTGTSKQPAEEEGGEETEVETTGFKLTFTFKENPYFTNTVSK
jgi:hypothetical protein